MCSLYQHLRKRTLTSAGFYLSLSLFFPQESKTLFLFQTSQLFSPFFSLINKSCELLFSLLSIPVLSTHHVRFSPARSGNNGTLLILMREKKIECHLHIHDYYVICMRRLSPLFADIPSKNIDSDLHNGGCEILKANKGYTKSLQTPLLNMRNFRTFYFGGRKKRMFNLKYKNSATKVTIQVFTKIFFLIKQHEFFWLIIKHKSTTLAGMVSKMICNKIIFHFSEKKIIRISI